MKHAYYTVDQKQIGGKMDSRDLAVSELKVLHTLQCA